MADVENRYTDLVDPAKPVVNPAISDALDCAQGTEVLARHFGLRQQVATVSTACSSSANAMGYGARLLQAGVVDRVICGGVDTLTRFTLNGFNSLRNTDAALCKPFDEHRNGLNLGEGAAYLVLESDKSLAVTGRKPLGLLSGYFNYNEAFHPTAPSPDGNGAYEAMAGALRQAALAPREISYINAHGTATFNNDIAEAKAMIRLFGEAMPPFSSTKSYTGHTLAAAGAMEAVFSLLSILHGEIYPSLRFDTPMSDAPLIPLRTLQEGLSVDHVLSSSFGFGGNNASLILSRYA
ncbi:MAG: beta-ketoacyl-[acyl-carrier-protein] synthase family protein [Flavihumibacter sp.]